MTQIPEGEFGELIRGTSPAIVAEAILRECDNMYARWLSPDLTLATFDKLYSSVHCDLPPPAFEEFDEHISYAFDSGNHDAWYLDSDEPKQAVTP